MSIKSIKVKNLLSFDELIIDNFEDINCIVGKNNAGKSNLLKLIRFFYNKLDGKRELSPQLYSNYSAFGTITIVYDISHIKKIVTADKNIANKKLGYFKEIYNLLVARNNTDFFELTLKIHSNELVEWSIEDKKTRDILSDIYPFFDIEARHINLYDWNKLWLLISRLKPFNPHKVKQKEIIKFFDGELTDSNSENYKNYEKYIKIIEDNLETGSYNYSQKVLSFIKSGLKGQSFLIGQENLETQSDGTNSHKFIETFISLLILLTRKAYITPILYIDEPEVGLHPKRNEELIENIYETYNKVLSKTPYPTIILTTHSPNIVKQVIKLFDENQQILHFSKKEKKDKMDIEKYPTIVQKMNSQYEDKRFLNVFSDNEARLFFSNFILFVEGATEIEIFRNKKLNQNFKCLKNIDIYEAKESMLKYINPAYSNTSIPYLILYDADKFLIIDLDKNKMSQPTRGNVINHIKLQEKYIKSFPNLKVKSNQYLLLKSIKFYLKIFKEANIVNDNIFIHFIEYKGNKYTYKQFINAGNKFLFSRENKFFNRTTMEEVLINIDSFILFKKWLFHELKKSIKESYNEKTPKSCIQNQIKKKIKKLKEFKIYIDENFLTEKEKVIVAILLFEGKTETSIKSTMATYTKYLPIDFRKKMEFIEKYIKDKQELKLGHILEGKTSGWVTSFLNFSINEIEKNRGKEKFKDEFKKYFRELYDIISIIEDKLDCDR